MKRTRFRDATLYKWRQKCGGMEVPPLGGASLACRSMEAKRLKALEEENSKLKRLLAEQILDVAARKDMLGESF